MTSDRRGVLHLEAGPFPLLPDSDQAFSVWRTGYGILEVARLHAYAPEGALYVCHGAELRLLAVRGADQSALDLVTEVWPKLRNDFAQGRPWAIDEPPTVVLACADQRGLVGLVLLRWPAGTRPRSVTGLRALSLVLATLLRRLRGDADEVSEIEAPHFENEVVSEDALYGVTALGPTRSSSSLHLRVLLEQNDWNITRVSRILGVTRMTIYNRLHRQRVKRQRVPKSHRRLIGAHIVNLIAEPVPKDKRLEPAPPAERPEAVPDETAVPTEA